MAVSEEEGSTIKSESSSFSSTSSSVSSPAVHYLAKCVLRPSVVLQVAYGYFRSRSFRDIVFGKETCLELAVICEDGILQSICEQPVFGSINDLGVLPWSNKLYAKDLQTVGKDLLVVVSDSGKLSFLSFCNEMHRFSPVAHIQLSCPGNSRHQLGRLLTIDSSGSFVAVGAYQDQFALFSLSVSATSDIIDKKIHYPADASSARSLHHEIESGTIWSMCFISQEPSKKQNPVLAIIMNRSGTNINELLLFCWNIGGNAISLISKFGESETLAHSIVEVPNFHGFAFLFRVGDALLMDLRDPENPCCIYRTSLVLVPAALEEQNCVEESCRVPDVDDEGFNVAACALLELSDSDPMCIDSDSGNRKVPAKNVCSWSWDPESDKTPRMIISLDDGELFMIELSFNSGGIRATLSDCLHKDLRCKALLWVVGGFLAAFVDMGDGMVLKMESEKLVYASSIQNIAPILDMSVLTDNDDKRDHMFTGCGVGPEGSLRVIRSGISVEKLLRTAPIYQGITGTWTIRMKVNDSYHSFLVLSFVEETRVLSVGLSFTDVTDSVGFESDVCTLACGLVDDGLLVQIHQHAVRLCLPTKVAHSEGIPFSSPVCTSWLPGDYSSISLGAVGHGLIVVCTSNPCLLFILGVRSQSAYHCGIFEMQHIELQYELSSISIPQKYFGQTQSSSPISLASSNRVVSLPAGVDRGYTFVIGTHRPSVEVLSVLNDGGVKVLASGMISLTNTMGTAISGCIPQDVRLVLVDQFYVLSGLRNGMLLRFEWPHSQPNSVELSQQTSDLPINLQLIANRRIGITPVFLVPLSDSHDADIIALSDRPWLLHTARHSLSYTSISFQSSTHATPVCCVECPKGIIFVAESSLNLMEMVHCKRLNVQKIHLGGTPRRILYHNDSRQLIVLRTGLDNSTTNTSDICIVDPISGSVVSMFRFAHGETGKSMELVRAGIEEVLVVGTSLSSGPAIMPSGEAESTKGRLIVLSIEHLQTSDSDSRTFCTKAGSLSQRTSPFRDIVGCAAEQLSSSSICSSPDDTSCDGVKLEENELWQLRVVYSANMPGMVLAISPYLDRFFLASAGSAFYVCGFSSLNPLRVKKLAGGRTRFMITMLTAYFTRIAVGDCRDGILFYSYQEDAKKLEQVYCDPSQRLVADCILMDVNTAVVSDRKGSIAVLSCSDRLEDSANPECNLTPNSAYYMGEIALNIRKGSYIYKLPAEDALKGCYGLSTNIDTTQKSIIASTLLGSIFILIPISREDSEILEVVQAKLVLHPLTAPILGNDHKELRSRENPGAVPKMLDGDMLAQFLELTTIQQEAVLSTPLPCPATFKSSSKPLSSLPLIVNQVVQLLERIHYAVN